MGKRVTQLNQAEIINNTDEILIDNSTYSESKKTRLKDIRLSNFNNDIFSKQEITQEIENKDKKIREDLEQGRLVPSNASMADKALEADLSANSISAQSAQQAFAITDISSGLGTQATFNDNAVASWDNIWSSQKTTSETNAQIQDLQTKLESSVVTVGKADIANIAGQLINAHDASVAELNDEHTSGSTTLWSSQKTMSEFKAKMNGLPFDLDSQKSSYQKFIDKYQLQQNKWIDLSFVGGKYYYTDFSAAINDINNNTTTSSTIDSTNAVAQIFTDGTITVLRILQDLEYSNNLLVEKSLILDLNGHELYLHDNQIKFNGENTIFYDCKNGTFKVTNPAFTPSFATSSTRKCGMVIESQCFMCIGCKLDFLSTSLNGNISASVYLITILAIKTYVLNSNIQFNFKNNIQGYDYGVSGLSFFGMNPLTNSDIFIKNTSCNTYCNNGNCYGIKTNSSSSCSIRFFANNLNAEFFTETGKGQSLSCVNADYIVLNHCKISGLGTALEQQGGTDNPTENGVIGVSIFNTNPEKYGATLLFVNNCKIIGAHSGLQTYNTISFVSNSNLKGTNHGGIYVSGNSFAGICYLYNCDLTRIPTASGHTESGWGSSYFSYGSTSYISHCNFHNMYPVTSYHERPTKVYISDSIVPNNKFRVDKGNTLYVGQNMPNIENTVVDGSGGEIIQTTDSYYNDVKEIFNSSALQLLNNNIDIPNTVALIDKIFSDSGIVNNKDSQEAVKDFISNIANYHIPYANTIRKTASGKAISLTDVSTVKHNISCNITSTDKIKLNKVKIIVTDGKDYEKDYYSDIFGNIENIESVSPQMFINTDNNTCTLNVKYNVDTQSYVDDLQTKLENGTVIPRESNWANIAREAESLSNPIDGISADFYDDTVASNTVIWSSEKTMKEVDTKLEPLKSRIDFLEHTTLDYREDDSVAYIKDVPIGASENTLISKFGGLTHKSKNLCNISNIPLMASLPFVVEKTDVSELHLSNTNPDLLTKENYAVITANYIDDYFKTLTGKTIVFSINKPLSYGIQFKFTYIKEEGSLGQNSMSIIAGTQFSNSFIVPKNLISINILVTGINNKVFDDVVGLQIEENSIATFYEPYFEGLRNSKVTGIKVEGKNLISYPYIYSTRTEEGVTYIDNKDGSITVSGTATGYSAFLLSEVLIRPNTTYFLSGLTDECRNIALECSFYKDDKKLSTISQQNNFSFSTQNYPEANKILINIKRRANTQTSGTIYPQLEIGSSPTSYIPYTNPEILDIPEEVTGYFEGYGIGVSKKSYNTIDLVNQKYINKCEKVIIDGQNVKVSYVSNYADGYYAIINVGRQGDFNSREEILATGFSSAFSYKPYHIFVASSGKPTLCVTDEFTDIQTANEWFNKKLTEGHPIEIVYKAKNIISVDASVLKTDGWIKTHQGGSITFENEFKQPTPSTVNFLLPKNNMGGNV